MMQDDDFNNEDWWSFVFRKDCERDNVLSSSIRDDEDDCEEMEDVNAPKDINYREYIAVE